ncbi:MAG: hypothetical protein P9L90_04520 [Candidatus Aadella gelida]|nr:hypothetical protein [Candidatus Aadella gelida]
MSNATTKRDRLSIDVRPEEHKRIKVFAALRGETIREYVIESIRERLRSEDEETQMMALTTKTGEVFKELWDNEKDAQYDAV